MTRTKWVRLGVRDPADILRWAAGQGTRGLDEFRHRVIGGREFVSFRLVPRYAIEIGTTDILVVAHVKLGPRQQFTAAIATLRRKTVRRVGAAIATLRHRAAPAPLPTAELYRLPVMRRSPSFR